MKRNQLTATNLKARIRSHDYRGGIRAFLWTDRFWPEENGRARAGDWPSAGAGKACYHSIPNSDQARGRTQEPNNVESVDKEATPNLDAF